MYDKIIERVNLGIDAFETAAVLTMSETEAKKAYRHLKEKREDVYFMNRDSSEFKKGITVTTYYMAKGLEFDQVFVLGENAENPFHKQFQYISATRALHELYILTQK